MIWEAADPDKGLNPNRLKQPDKIDDYWLVPNLNKFHKYSKLPAAERAIFHLAATTMQSYVGYSRQFIKFLVAWSIWTGIRYTLLVNEIKAQSKSLLYQSKTILVFL